MAKMELGEYMGEWLYFNSEPGGVVTGFGTLRLFNTETASNVDIYFDSANAHVDNWASNVNIYNNYENNWINNSGNNVNIYATKGSSAIGICNQRGKYVRINALGDLPYNIYNTDSGLYGYGTPDNVTIITGNGNNYIKNEGHTVEMTTGTGNDTIDNNKGTNITIDSGAGNDIVNNSGSKVTIDVGVDNDIVNNNASDVQIYSGGGDDIVNNQSSNVTINTEEDNDFISNNGSNVKIYAGEDGGLDTVSNNGDLVEINTGAGNDSVYNTGANVKINADTGNDTVNNNGNSVEINTGAGNDSVYNTGANVKINADTGNDTVNNNGNSVEINTGEGNDSISNSSSNVKINAGYDSDVTVSNSGNSVEINTAASNDPISNSGENVFIDAGVGNDTVENSGSQVKIYSGMGDDVVNNSKLNVTIYAGANDQSLYEQETPKNLGDYVMINAASSDDIIHIDAKQNVLISAPNNNVQVNNAISGAVVVNAGGGNDKISNSGEKIIINAGTGDDQVENTANNVTINAGAGKDTVKNKGNDVSIYAATDDIGDTFHNEGNNVTIEMGAGDDYAFSSGDNVSINAGDGKNTIENTGDKVTIKSIGNNSSINSGDGECSIDNGEYSKGNILGSGTTIKAGKSNDFINNVANAVSINAGDGDNTVTNAFYDNSLENMVKFFVEGQDNFVDLIMEFTGNSTKYTQGGEGVTVISGKGNDVIMNFGSYSSIHSGKGEDRIFSADGEYNIINGGDDDDQIAVYHDNKSLILGGDGNDEIIVSRLGVKEYLEAAKFVASTTANELVLNRAKKYISDIILSTVSKRLIGKFIPWAGLALNLWDFFKTRKNLIDEFSLESEIVGGKGNDFVACDALAPRIYYYNNGDGNDTISGFSNAQLAEYLSEFLVADMPISTLYIESGNVESVTVNGSDVILKIGSGSITLEDGVNQKFNLKEANGTSTTRAYGKDEETGELICSIWGAAADEVIKDTIKPENTRYALYGYRNAIGMASGITTREDGKDELHGNAKNDTLYGGTEDTLYGYGGNDLLYGKNNSLLDGGEGNDIIYSGKEDTHSLQNVTLPSGGNKNTIYGGIGDDIIYNYGNETFIEGGDNDDRIYNYGANFMAEGGHFVGGNKVTINGGAGNDIINLYLDKKSTNSVETFITYKNGDGNDIIYGFNETSTLKVIGAEYSMVKNDFDWIIKVGEDSITLKDTAFLDTINIDGQKIEDTVPTYPAGLSIDGNKLSLSKDFKETTLNVNDFSEPINIIDAAELLNGIKIFGNSSINLFYGSNYGDVYYCEYPAESNIKTSGRVLESSSTVTPNATINAAGGNDTIYGNGSKILYQYAKGDGNDIIYGFTNKDTLQITGGDYTSLESGDDVILNVGEGSITLKETKNISLNIDGNFSGLTGLSVVGTKQADTLRGGAGDDTFTGGKGNDIFVHEGGNDTITDYTPGQDKISLSSGKVNNSTLNGADIIIYTDEDSITVQNGKNKKITVIDGDGNTTTEIFGRLWYSENRNEISLTSIFTGILNASDYDSSVAKIDATEVTRAVKIFGNDNNNTITGGKGNDTLTGGKGKDIFVYANGTGNKFIADYTEGEDKISIQGVDEKSVKTAINTATISNGNVIFKVGSNRITVNNGEGQIITLIDENGNEYSYPTAVDLNSAGTAATITAEYKDKTFDFTDYGTKLKTVDGAAATVDLEIFGNNLANKIIGGSGNDTLNGGIGKGTLTGGKGKDIFVYANGTGNKIITDYTEGEDKILIQNADIEDVINRATTSKGNVIFKVGSNTITVNNGEDKEIILLDGTGKEYRYKEIVKFNSGKTATTLTSEYTEVTFDATNYYKLKTIDASAVKGNIEIIGNRLANKILGGDGNDTLTGGVGKDTLTGGNGADIFVYANGTGNKIITDYTEGEDKILIQGVDEKTIKTAINTATISKGNVIFKVGSNRITVNNGEGQIITLIDENGKEYSYPTAVNLNSAKTAATITSEYKEKVFDFTDYGAKLKTVDGSAATVDLEIFGNNLANKIIGGAGSNTLWGGKGNDLLIGGDGADTFIYEQGDGKDVIQGATSADLVVLSNISIDDLTESGKSYFSGNDILFKFNGSGSLNVKNGKTSGVAVKIESTQYYVNNGAWEHK